MTDKKPSPTSSVDQIAHLKHIIHEYIGAYRLEFYCKQELLDGTLAWLKQQRHTATYISPEKGYLISIGGEDKHLLPF